MSAVDPYARRRRGARPLGEVFAEQVLAPARRWALRLLAQVREQWRAREIAERGLPLALVVVAGAVLLWTHMLDLQQGFWGDELVSVVAYIHAGPSNIFGHYVPNDHMFFELLTWATTGLWGDHSAAADRFWSVVPAVAAVALTTWWLWRRLDAWVAAIFAVLAGASPLLLDLGTEARGYGLGFLSGAVMIIAADRIATTRWRGVSDSRGAAGSRGAALSHGDVSPRGALALFVAGGLLGIWTLPVIVLPFLGVAVVLLQRRAQRRGVLYAVAVVGVASLLFYLPVLADLLSSARQQAGALLAWHSVLFGPSRDLLAPNVSLLLSGASVSLDEAIASAILVAGAVALWRRPERVLVLLLLAPAIFTYLVLKLGGFYVVDLFEGHSALPVLDIEDRFTSFLLLPLLALCAVGLVALGRSLARVQVHLPASVRTLFPEVSAVRPLGPLVVAGALVFSLVALADVDRLAVGNAKVPIENYREVATIVLDSRVGSIMTNSTQYVGFEYYLNRPITVLSPAVLGPLFCTKPAPFVYIEHRLYSKPADTTCLKQRGAVSIRVPQRRALPTVIWILRNRRGPGVVPAGVVPAGVVPAS